MVWEILGIVILIIVVDSWLVLFRSSWNLAGNMPPRNHTMLFYINGPLSGMVFPDISLIKVNDGGVSTNLNLTSLIFSRAYPYLKTTTTAGVVPIAASFISVAVV